MHVIIVAILLYLAYLYSNHSYVYKIDACTQMYNLVVSCACNHVYQTHDRCVSPFSISKYIDCKYIEEIDSWRNTLHDKLGIIGKIVHDTARDVVGDFVSCHWRS